MVLAGDRALGRDETCAKAKILANKMVRARSPEGDVTAVAYQRLVGHPRPILGAGPGEGKLVRFAGVFGAVDLELEGSRGKRPVIWIPLRLADALKGIHRGEKYSENLS